MKKYLIIFMAASFWIIIYPINRFTDLHVNQNRLVSKGIHLNSQQCNENYIGISNFHEFIIGIHHVDILPINFNSNKLSPISGNKKLDNGNVWHSLKRHEDFYLPCQFQGEAGLDIKLLPSLNLDDACDDIHLLQADSHTLHNLPDNYIITQNNSKYIGTENNFSNLAVYLDTFLCADNNLFLYNKTTILPNHRANPKTETNTLNNPALPGCTGSCRGIA